MWFQLPSTIGKVGSQSEGATPLTRNRYKEGYFLELELPLPPIDIQKAAVSYLNQRVEMVLLSEKVQAMKDALVRASLNRLFE